MQIFRISQSSAECMVLNGLLPHRIPTDIDTEYMDGEAAQNWSMRHFRHFEFWLWPHVDVVRHIVPGIPKSGVDLQPRKTPRRFRRSSAFGYLPLGESKVVGG